MYLLRKVNMTPATLSNRSQNGTREVKPKGHFVSHFPSNGVCVFNYVRPQDEPSQVTKGS